MSYADHIYYFMSPYGRMNPDFHGPTLYVFDPIGMDFFMGNCEIPYTVRTLHFPAVF